MSAPVIVQPDLEQWVWAHLRDLPGEVTSFAYAARQLDPIGWLYAWFIQVDARHSKRKAAARDLAERARQILLSLGSAPWPDGCVAYVQPIEGPFWFPDLEDGMPRYCARYEIRVHPRRRAAAIPEELADASSTAHRA